MAGKDDDIERLLAEMEALNAQADSVLGGDDASGKGVAKRRGDEAVPPAKAEASGEGMSPATLRALVVSGAATGLVALVFFLLAVLPFFARPGLSDILAVFLSSLLVAGFYSLRSRGR
jgi:hypothetical protein